MGSLVRISITTKDESSARPGAEHAGEAFQRDGFQQLVSEVTLGSRCLRLIYHARVSQRQENAPLSLNLKVRCGRQVRAG